MSISRLHALVDALSQLNGWSNPRSEAYRLRNPLLLKAYSPKHICDDQGRRIFSSFTAGYDNSLLDCRIKCSGKSHSKLTPDNTLMDLVCVYGNDKSATRSVKNFLQAALQTDMIFNSQKLSWFLEDEIKEPKDV